MIVAFAAKMKTDKFHGKFRCNPSCSVFTMPLHCGSFPFIQISGQAKKKRKNKLREVDDEQAIGDGSAPFMEQPPLGAS